MDDYKKRVAEALRLHAEKHLKKLKPKRRHGKPEKLVEASCVQWMSAQGWQVEIYESKAQYNPKAGRFISQNIKAGHPDCAGVLPSGVAAFVEFKAPGRIKTFNLPKNYRQRQFIKEKININAFACVVDSVDLLQKIFTTWSHIETKEEKIAYLVSMLP